MDRFTRYKVLRALWARAKTLIAWLNGPRHQEARLRAQRWQQVNIAERHILDGVVRSGEDPDTTMRPQERQRGSAAAQAHWEARRQWDEAHRRQGYEAQQRQHHRHGGRR